MLIDFKAATKPTKQFLYYIFLYSDEDLISSCSKSPPFVDSESEYMPSEDDEG